MTQNIQKQVVLPLKHTVQIALNSLRMRIIRSLITLSGVILAIALLSSISYTYDLNTGLKALGSNEVNLLLQENGVDPNSIGLDDKTKFLFILALLLSSVGIVNAMLMSVTERYKEIGTMKCLGALDSLIIKLFVIESAIQGFAGSMIGVILGFTFTYVPSYFKYGAYVFNSFNFSNFLLSSAGALVIGVVLSVVFAIYPAYLAAKMKPVDAMRVDA